MKMKKANRPSMKYEILVGGFLFNKLSRDHFENALYKVEFNEPYNHKDRFHNFNVVKPGIYCTCFRIK